ncbi:5'-3' exonuclease, partial [Haematococcus lacustris]
MDSSAGSSSSSSSSSSNGSSSNGSSSSSSSSSSNKDGEAVKKGRKKSVPQQQLDFMDPSSSNGSSSSNSSSRGGNGNGNGSIHKDRNGSGEDRHSSSTTAPAPSSRAPNHPSLTQPPAALRNPRRSVKKLSTVLESTGTAIDSINSSISSSSVTLNTPKRVSGDPLQRVTQGLNGVTVAPVTGPRAIEAAADSDPSLSTPQPTPPLTRTTRPAARKRKPASPPPPALPTPPAANNQQLSLPTTPTTPATPTTTRRRKPTHPPLPDTDPDAPALEAPRQAPTSDPCPTLTPLTPLTPLTQPPAEPTLPSPQAPPPHPASPPLPRLSADPPAEPPTGSGTSAPPPRDPPGARPVSGAAAGVHQGGGRGPPGPVLLVDGHSLAYRGYHALQTRPGSALHTSSGVPTAVCHTFLSTLFLELQQLHPSAVVVAFDKGHSFRKQLANALAFLADPQLSGLDQDQFVNVCKVLTAMLQGASEGQPGAPLLAEDLVHAALQGLGSEGQPGAPLLSEDLMSVALQGLPEPLVTSCLEQGAADSDYKKGRAESTQEFQTDLRNLRQVLAAMRVPIVIKQDVEADDVLAALVQKAVTEGRGVRILTGDRDLFQLVDDAKDVAVLYPQKPSGSRASSCQLVKEAEVMAAYGVLPAQLAEYKALVGDASDNIPGVKGLGSKTAPKLLAQFSSLDELVQGLEGLSPRNRALFNEEGIKSAYASRLLAQLAAPLVEPSLLPDLMLQGFVLTDALEQLEQLELKKLAQQLPAMLDLLGGEASPGACNGANPHSGSAGNGTANNGSNGSSSSSS